MLLQALAYEPASFLAQVSHDSEHFDEEELLQEASDLQRRLKLHPHAVQHGRGIEDLQDSLTAARRGLRGASACRIIGRRPD